MYFSKFNVKKNFEKFSKSYNTLFELSPAKGTIKKVLHEVRDFLFGCVASSLA